MITNRTFGNNFMNNKKYSEYLQISLIIFFLSCSGYLNSQLNKPLFNVSKQQSALNFNDYFLMFVGASNKRLISDLFWISTLIESDLDHYKKKDLNSWMYLRFKTITFLDPKNLKVYQFGGKYLSIIKDDLLGAQQIFEKGLTYYPQDFDLNFDAGFLYGFELDDFDKAIEKYENIINHPRAPNFLIGIINKLKFEKSKDLNLAFRLNLERYSQLPDGPMKQKVHSELYAIKAQIDLECLNSFKDHCEKSDFEKIPYFKDNSGNYKSVKNYKEYKLYKKGRD